MIKFVLATVVLYIAKTYAAYPKAKKIPPINPGIPDFFIEQDSPEKQYTLAGLNRVDIVATALSALGEEDAIQTAIQPVRA